MIATLIFVVICAPSVWLFYQQCAMIGLNKKRRFLEEYGGEPPYLSPEYDYLMWKLD